MGILAILIIALFVITLSFKSVDNNQMAQPESQGSEAVSTTDGDISGSSAISGLPAQRDLKLLYMKEQLKNQDSETRLSYQQQLEQQRMEYSSLMLQEKMLHEKELLEAKNKHEETILKRKLQKEYILKQQDSSLLSQEKQYDAQMADRLIAFETRKQLLAQQHEEALLAKNQALYKQSLITYTMIASGTIFLLSLSYYLVGLRKNIQQKEIMRLEQEHIYSLKQQESMQETRIKVLESISDLPEKDKKEIIVGLIGLNRPFEELENKVVEEPPIEIELTELTPPQMKVQPSEKVTS